MTEIVYGPRVLTFRSATDRAAYPKLLAAQILDELAAAWRADPTAAGDWLVDAGIMSRIGGLLRPGPCTHLRAVPGGTCPDCQGVHP